MVEKKEATRVARNVRVGGKVHRLAVVLESDRELGRYYVDDVVVTVADFDRIITLAEMPDEQT